MDDNQHVDPKQIQNLIELGGTTLLMKMIDLYLENAPLRLREVLENERQNNWEGVFQAVHKLKSSSGNFGANPLFELCGRIEQSIRENQMADVPPRLREMETRLQEVLTILQAERERLHV